MDLIILVLILSVIGFAVWLFTTQIPMPPIFKTVIYFVCAIALILFLLREFAGSMPNILR